MHKDNEAEQVLREGLRNNPQSYEILFELGRLYDENYHDEARARNVWELAARYWLKLPADEQKDNKLILEQITTHLGQLEEIAGNFPQAINWFHAAQKVSLTPGVLQKQIDEIQAKIAGRTNSPAALPR
jgi:hypothetical protein